MNLKRIAWIAAFVIVAYLVWEYFGPKIAK